MTAVDKWSVLLMPKATINMMMNTALRAVIAGQQNALLICSYDEIDVRTRLTFRQVNEHLHHLHHHRLHPGQTLLVSLTRILQLCGEHVF